MVNVNTGQKAAMSSQAAAYLENIRHPPFPSLLSPFIASPSRILNIRQTIGQKLAALEEQHIKRYNLTITETTVADIPVIVIEPHVIAPDNESKILINIFGGGFVMGTPRERAALIMAGECGIRVYSIGYSLSPEVRYPIARNECFEVYRKLVEIHEPANIYAMGSSSGATLMITTLLLAHKDKLPMPARLFLCTPAVDFTGAGDSMVSNADRDIMPVALLSAMVRQNYSPTDSKFDFKNPLFSPLFASYDAAWPPTVITSGTRDISLSSSVRFYWKLREAGAKIELLVGEGMWHGFNWEVDIPEAIALRAAVREFLFSDN
ncbi:alpha/beta-hydrolase [Cadophora sp. DSE1049]|nr:alpha/beta-hydrolase [Cadophora sp. DSE1049]